MKTNELDSVTPNCTDKHTLGVNAHKYIFFSCQSTTTVCVYGNYFCTCQLPNQNFNYMNKQTMLCFSMMKYL